MALERYHLKLKIKENSHTSEVIIEDAEKQKMDGETIKGFSIARKICLINLASFGMTIITSGVLRPKHPDTKIVHIYSSTSFLRAADSTAIDVYHTYEILETVLKEKDLIVDVSSYSAFEFMNGLEDYEGSANDFDRFVIPTQSSLYAHEKTVYVIKKLFQLGVSPKKIRIIFNMYRSHGRDLKKEFERTITFLEENNIDYDTSAIIPKDRAYFKNLYSSASKKPHHTSKSPPHESYHLQRDGTDGTILHKRARKSLLNHFTKINEHIYK